MYPEPTKERIKMVSAIFMPRMFGKSSNFGRLRNRAIFTETKALSAATQTGSEYEIPNKGDMAGLIVEVTAQTTGSLSSAKKLALCISSLDIRDVHGVPVFNSIAGADLKYLKMWSGKQGKSLTETDVATAQANTDVYLIQHSIDSGDLPAKIQITYNPYSSMATSGTTACTATISVTPYYRDNTTNKTDRIQKVVMSVAAGLNNLVPQLPRNRLLLKTAFAYTAAYLTDVTISADGAEELKVTANQLNAYEDELFYAGHVAGYGFIDHSPFVVTDTAIMNWNSSTADTLSMYQFLRDM